MGATVAAAIEEYAAEADRLGIADEVADDFEALRVALAEALGPSAPVGQAGPILRVIAQAAWRALLVALRAGGRVIARSWRAVAAALARIVSKLRGAGSRVGDVIVGAAAGAAVARREEVKQAAAAVAQGLGLLLSPGGLLLAAGVFAVSKFADEAR